MDLAQKQQRRDFEQLGETPWTVVNDSVFQVDERNFGIYCALSSPLRRDRALSDASWDLMVTDGAPGFSQSWADDKEITTYHPGASLHDGVEPLILHREFHGVAESTIEIDQQFRLFHNLRYDTLSGTYFKMNEDGSHAEAIKVEGKRVSIRTPLLRQYIAARQMDLLLFIDSVVWADHRPSDLPEQQDIKTDRITGFVYCSARPEGVGSKPFFSRFLATKVVTHGPIETCGIWPYEGKDTNFPEFIIGEDEYGKPVMFTCEVDKLADYFGKNPDAPHYLTPVHFRKDVLQKYFTKPELYSVGDGYLRCAGLWGLRMDNDHDDRVVVFLGDLGRDLPSAERDYWRGFMMPPDRGVSETNFRRSFLGQFTDPAALDLKFRRLYVKANEAASSCFGWPIFREPMESDVYLLNQLRLPLNDTDHEFEEAIKLLAKLMSDALNEPELQKQLPTKIPDEKGIGKFERFLTAQAYPQVQRDIAYLRKVQDLRSKLTAHRKGSDYEKVLGKHFGTARGQAAIRSLFEEGIEFLSSFELWCRDQSE